MRSSLSLAWLLVALALFVQADTEALAKEAANREVEALGAGSNDPELFSQAQKHALSLIRAKEPALGEARDQEVLKAFQSTVKEIAQIDTDGALTSRLFDRLVRVLRREKGASDGMVSQLRGKVATLNNQLTEERAKSAKLVSAVEAASNGPRDAEILKLAKSLKASQASAGASVAASAGGKPARGRPAHRKLQWDSDAKCGLTEKQIKEKEMILQCPGDVPVQR